MVQIKVQMQVWVQMRRQGVGIKETCNEASLQENQEVLGAADGAAILRTGGHSLTVALQQQRQRFAAAAGSRRTQHERGNGFRKW
jgi:hypothetical protein